MKEQRPGKGLVPEINEAINEIESFDKKLFYCIAENKIINRET